MGIFSKKQTRDILFLMPVRLEGEKSPRGQIRMLYCDADGKVYTTMMNRTIFQRARDIADGMEKARKLYAIIGQAIDKGDFIPVAVEINSEEEQALEYALEHALKSGKLPDILKKYIKPIIKRGQTSQESVPTRPRPK
jgi:hypothetical protein